MWLLDSRHHASWTKLAKAVSKTGDGYLQVLIPSVLLITDDELGTQFFTTVGIAFLIYLPIYWVLKNCFKRRRPPHLIPAFRCPIKASDEFSFPSGHSAAAFLLANLTALFYGIVAWPLYVWASLVALSRVVLGVHFPTDILAGITLGTVVAFQVLPLTL